VNCATTCASSETAVNSAGVRWERQRGRTAVRRHLPNSANCSAHASFLTSVYVARIHFPYAAACDEHVDVECKANLCSGLVAVVVADGEVMTAVEKNRPQSSDRPNPGLETDGHHVRRRLPHHLDPGRSRSCLVPILLEQGPRFLPVAPCQVLVMEPSFRKCLD